MSIFVTGPAAVGRKVGSEGWGDGEGGREGVACVGWLFLSFGVVRGTFELILIFLRKYLLHRAHLGWKVGPSFVLRLSGYEELVGANSVLLSKSVHAPERLILKAKHSPATSSLTYPTCTPYSATVYWSTPSWTWTFHALAAECEMSRRND